MVFHNGMARNVGPGSGIALLEYLRFDAAAGVCADRYFAHDGAVMIDKSVRINTYGFEADIPLPLIEMW